MGEPLPALWLAGASILLLYFICSYHRCAREFRTAIPAPDTRFLREWSAGKHLRRRVRILVSDKIEMPLTYGICRPVILLPKQIHWADETALTFILEHEFAHIRRLDALCKPLLCAALCVHWFNPLVWVMCLLANRDIELACDEKVIRTTGYQSRACYAKLLVEWEENEHKQMILLPNFMQYPIKERIVSIMKMKQLSFTGIILALVLTTGVATAFAATSAGGSAPSAPAKQSVPSSSQAAADDRTLNGLFETYTVAEYEQATSRF